MSSAKLLVKWDEVTTVDPDVPLLMDESKGGNAKYTCRYEIQIEQDNKFTVAKKIIGPKGRNMKGIVERVTGGKNFSDQVKLRVRGKGSGFKEGPKNQESDEPLQLCVSAKQEDKYNVACREVEKLLTDIYEKYYKFLNGRGEKKSIKKLEGSSDQNNEVTFSRRKLKKSSQGAPLFTPSQRP